MRGGRGVGFGVGVGVGVAVGIGEGVLVGTVGCVGVSSLSHRDSIPNTTPMIVDSVTAI